MKKLIALAAMALVAIAASCDTENVGGPPVFFSIGAITVTPADPAGLFGNESATFSATAIGGVPNYTWSWNFGGASTPSPSVSPAGQTTSITQTLTSSATPQTYTVTVTGTDGNGIQATATVVINVGATRNAAPTISAALAGNQITATVADVDVPAQTLTVSAVASAGLSVTPASQVAAGGSAVFTVSATDIIAGATGTVTLTVDDANGGSANTTVNVTIAPLVLPADTLVAIPLTSSAATGADVQVAILTGDPANPFQYMVGAGVTIESDATYKANSFDVGVPDATPDVGSVNPVDGIWAAMAPGGGFLLAPDNFIQSTDIGGGRERWDFNITPLGGSNQAAPVGGVFNAIWTFTAAGAKTFGFQEVAGVKRTYYADDATEYFWGNITNDGSVGPNGVTIN